MNKEIELKTKKNIAKEILLFLGSVIFALLIYLLVFPYNNYCISKVKEIDNLVILKTKEFDSLENNSYKELRKEYEEMLKDDWSEHHKEEFIKSINRVIASKSISELSPLDKAARLKGNTIENEIKTLILQKNKIERLIVHKQKWFTLKSFVIILIVLYPLRLLISLVMWSVKTLNQKDK